MKIFIGNKDWADEGDIFFCSIESEERLKKVRDLIDLYVELKLLPSSIEMYWGTNEFFDFTPEDLKQFIDNAKDISEEEYAVLKKFNVRGFDIYDMIESCLVSCVEANENVTEDNMKEIRNSYIELFSEEEWKDIEKAFKESRNQ